MVSALTDKISHLFDNADPVNTVKLCTIHRSKGLEADYVGIINEKLIPSKFAKSPTQLIQEKNLMYVARSRAEKSLMFLNFKDFVNG